MKLYVKICFFRNMKINNKINPCYTNLDMLNSIYKWIPSSENIRPIEDIIKKKDIDCKNNNIIYSTNIDQVLIRYFNINKKINRINNKFESKINIENLHKKVFIPKISITCSKRN